MPRLVRWEGKIEEVDFKVRRSAIDGTDKLMASVEVKGEFPLSVKAKEEVDRALTILAFTFGYPVKRVEESYTTILEHDPGVPKVGWGYHRVVTASDAVRLLDWHMIMATRLSKIENLHSEKKEVLVKAMALYREALGIENPLIAQIVFFSAGAAVARAMFPERLDNRGNLPTSALKEAYETVAGNTERYKFQELINKLYGDQNGRSGVDHGRINVINSLSVGNGTVLQPLLQGWTRALIIKFLDDNQPPVR